MRKPKARDASRARQELLHTWERMGRVLEPILAREPLVRGTLYERRRRCGRPGCRCARGELHVGQAFCVSEAGRTQHQPLAHVDPVRLRAGVAAYGEFRAARQQLRAASQQLLSLVDELEQARTIALETLKHSRSH